jgi:hypothetical protein
MQAAGSSGLVISWEISGTWEIRQSMTHWMGFGGKIYRKTRIFTMKYGGFLSIVPTKPIQ